MSANDLFAVELFVFFMLFYAWLVTPTQEPCNALLPVVLETSDRDLDIQELVMEIASQPREEFLRSDWDIDIDTDLWASEEPDPELIVQAAPSDLALATRMDLESKSLKRLRAFAKSLVGDRSIPGASKLPKGRLIESLLMQCITRTEMDRFLTA
jgi:hypothetical protein